MNPLRLLFHLLLVAVGGEAEWNAWTIRFVFGWVLSWISVLGLLSFSSVWLQLLSGSCGWEVVQGRRCQIMEPTADGLSPRISCSLPMFGVRSLIWKGEDGGWMDRFPARASGELQRQLELRKKKHSWGLCVIFQLLRVLFVKKGCTALLFNILYSSFFAKKNVIVHEVCWGNGSEPQERGPASRRSRSRALRVTELSRIRKGPGSLAKGDYPTGESRRPSQILFRITPSGGPLKSSRRRPFGTPFGLDMVCMIHDTKNFHTFVS